MALPPKIVILPGLDGTGRLLTDFVSILERSHPVEVIAYPPDEPLTYDTLLDHVRERLPSEDFVLIGESFSGPLAIRIALENPPFLKAVVLCASFARLDLPFKRLIAKMADRLPVEAIPFAVIDALLMNGRATAAQRELLKQVLRDLGKEVIALRVKEALFVDLVSTDFVIRQPVLYLRATADRLIPSGAADFIVSMAENVLIQDIAAPHFLFQTEPTLSARAIIDFVRF